MTEGLVAGDARAVGVAGQIAGGHGTAAEETPASSAGAMRTLVLGGARSGKSLLAERLLAEHRRVDYVATGGLRLDDPEWEDRVMAHRARRPSTWTTLETTALPALLDGPGPPLLIDCLTLWLTAVLDEADAWEPAAWAGGGRHETRRRIDELVRAWRGTPRRVVAVSNEVGSGIVPATPSGRLFRDELGRLNTLVAAGSEEVLLVVAGRALTLS